MGTHFSFKPVSGRFILFAAAVLGAGALSSGSTGCGRVYPSYSGVYRLKESSQPLGAERLGGMAGVHWPKTLTAYQHPFVRGNGVATTKIALGSQEKYSTGIFVWDAPLSADRKDTVSVDVIAPTTFVDFQSSPIKDPKTGQEMGPSCSYTYGATVEFAIAPGVKLMTDTPKGVYPDGHTETIGGREVSVRNPGPWSDQGVNTVLWEQTHKEIQVSFTLFKRPAYGNLGICNYDGSYVPQSSVQYVFTARYELETEIDSGDPRLERSDSQIQASLREVFGVEPTNITHTVFESPTDAGSLLTLF